MCSKHGIGWEGFILARYEYKYRKPRRRKPRLSSILMILAVLVVIAYPFFEGYHLNIQNYTARMANLPSPLKNLTIVYAADIHAGTRYSQLRVNQLIRTINGLSADVVLFGGDYADNTADTIAFFRNLPTVQARLGVFGVLGECDRSDPTALTTLIKAMTNAGVQPLVNTVGRLKVGKTYLYIAGSDDYYGGEPDVEGLAYQVSTDDFVIFLGHNPDLLTAALRATDSNGDNHWFDLALFGHTHGGQITLPGIPLIPDLIPDLGTRYLSGWLEENRANVLISNGVGTSYFPARLFAPAQIHLITLKSQ